jgi:hypothetical protein
MEHYAAHWPEVWGGAEVGVGVDRAGGDCRAGVDVIRAPRDFRELPCRRSDPDLWFDRDAYSDVARVCAACPFLRWCATQALAHEDGGYRVVGVWATVDFAEDAASGRYRRQIRKLQRIAATGLVPRIQPSGNKVCAVGTARRLQALVAMGYSLTYLCERLQITSKNASPLFRGDQSLVLATTARKVVSLFAELQSVPGPDDRSRRHAARRGWHPPPAWDINSIDDPAASPIAEGWTVRQARSGDRNRNWSAEAAAVSVPA